MNEKIKVLLDSSYSWFEGELYYRGNPLSWQNQTEWELKMVEQAQKELVREAK